MQKRVFLLFLSLLMLVVWTSPALAHENQKKHDDDLKQALFGSRDVTLSGEQKKKFQVIADAAALCIDQFSPNDTLQWKKTEFEELQRKLDELHLPKLDVSFEDIDLCIRVSADGKNITPDTHRKYTHMGWDYGKYPNQKFWEKRKDILLETVNRVMFTSNAPLSNIPWVSDVLYSPNEQCYAFCAIVYYVHILGDHSEGDVPEKLTDIEPLIQYYNLSVPGIIAEMKEYSQVLFSSQKGDWQFIALMQDLSELGIRVERNCKTWGKVDTVERCTENQKYAKQLLGILGTHLPKLLKNEGFYADVFK